MGWEVERAEAEEQFKCLAEEPEPHDVEMLMVDGSPHPVVLVCSCGDRFKLEPL